MNRLIRASILFLALAGAPAYAQDVVDPIGNLLDQVDEDTAETLGQTPQSVAPPAPLPPPAPPPAPSPTPPAQSPFPYGSQAPSRSYARPPQVSTPPAGAYASPPAAYAPRAPAPTEPVFVDDYGRTPERPLNSVELGYESRMRSSFAAAQGMQGPLDGAWTLRSGAQSVYTLLLVDKNNGRLEGAWRDPRRPGSRDSSGFLSSIQKIGTQLTVSFYPGAGAGVVSLTLTPAANGDWSGELTEGGRRSPVVMTRD